MYSNLLEKQFIRLSLLKHVLEYNNDKVEDIVRPLYDPLSRQWSSLICLQTCSAVVCRALPVSTHTLCFAVSRCWRVLSVHSSAARCRCIIILQRLRWRSLVVDPCCPDWQRAFWSQGLGACCLVTVLCLNLRGRSFRLNTVVYLVFSPLKYRQNRTVDWISKS